MSAVPRFCAGALGKLGLDYENDTTLLPQNPALRGFCWYDVDRLRVLYPQYKKVEYEDLISATYRGVGLSPPESPKPWTKLAGALSLGLGLPLAVLLLGLAGFWIANGFRRQSNGALS